MKIKYYKKLFSDRPLLQPKISNECIVCIEESTDSIWDYSIEQLDDFTFNIVPKNKREHMPPIFVILKHIGKEYKIEIILITIYAYPLYKVYDDEEDIMTSKIENKINTIANM